MSARDRLTYVREIFAYIGPHLSRERVRVVLGTLLSFVAAGFGIVSILLMAALLQVLRNGPPALSSGGIDGGRLLDLNQAGGEVVRVIGALPFARESTQAAIAVVGALLVLSTTTAVMCNVTSRWLWVSVRTRVIMEMQVGLFAHLLAQPMSFHVRNRAGGLLSRLHLDIGSVAAMLPLFFHTLLRTPFVIIGSLVVMLRTSPVLTLVTIATAIVYLVVSIVLGRLVRQSFIRQSRSRASLLSLAQEALLAIRVVKAFGAERAEVGELRGELEDLVREEVRGDLLSAQYPDALSQILSAAAAIVVAVVGLGLVATGDLREEGLILFLTASVALLLTSAVVAQSIMSLYQMAASAERVLELWRVRPALVDGPLRATGFERSITFSRVQFAYGDEPVLRDIDLELRRGEIVGVVGPSGSGKSTLADLLVRLYDPTGGRVLLDGEDIRSFGQESYRRLFGIVPQEALLFNDSVRKNIAYGREDVTDANIETAARVANAHGFIEKLSEGYGTLVGERGTRLSGGERQRIAIARALVGSPPVLIFDEATSALDNESERVVQEAIDRAISGHTALVIAHRITTVERADRIIVLETGRVVESGTHAELLRLGGLYRRLYERGDRGADYALAPSAD